MTNEQILDLDVDAPPEFLCPITMSIMKDPVIMPDGQTYEREAIAKALEVNPISPLTRQSMKIEDAKTNYALKSLIEKYIQDHLPEVQEDPKPIDPSNVIHTPTNEISLEHINKIEIQSFTAQYKDDLMLISIKPKEITGRLPISIIAMIDISGSMDCDASLALPGTEDTSLTRLQLVQYSLKTIISVLGSEDRITLITFSDRANVVLENVLLTEEGKTKANNIINSFRSGGCTNIWDALDKGIDQAIREKDAIKRQNQGDAYQINTSLLLFTDGEPNQNPPMGIIPSLEDKLSDLSIDFSISSFGFGYQIDSELMENIAQIGNGIYGYCPDATMVGTIFISYMSSIISMISPLSTLNINFNNGNQAKHALSLYNGASTNLMIRLNKNDNPGNVQISLNLPLTHQDFLVNEIKPLDDGDEQSLLNFRDQKYRKLLIDLILNCKKNNLNCDESIQKVKDLFDDIRQLQNRTQFLNNLMIDLFNDDEKHGQIERAYRQEYFNKWGKNYLFSLLRFHIVEQCGNFRDMSLQLYGNDTFKKFRRAANKIFMNLPIPEKQQRVRYSSHHRAFGSGSPSPPHVLPHTSTMRSYNRRSIACFNGEALVQMADGIDKRVDQLVKGDKLANGAKVACIVKTATENGQAYAVRIGKALFSPYHPIKVNIEGQKEKVWTFPVNVGEPKNVKIEFWYNIVLDKSCNLENGKNNNDNKFNATAIIGGIEAVTLGHGITDGVCKHPYFGTEKVITALMKYEEFKSGLIEFKKSPVIKRDPITDMIIECY